MYLFRPPTNQTASYVQIFRTRSSIQTPHRDPCVLRVPFMFGVYKLYVALLALALVPCALANALPKSSTAQPHPFRGDVRAMSQAAGMCQQTYCPSYLDKPGRRVGDAKLLWTTGDGYVSQRALIYHSKSLGLTVAFQGTNMQSLLSQLHDIELVGVPADWRYNKGLPQAARLFFGFQGAYLEIVDAVFAAVQRYMAQLEEERLTIVGHSLGAAMGLVAASDFHYRIPTGVTNMYLFGLPRVGNPVFADWVDETFGHKLHWTVNGHDWVPHLAPREFGYQHPSNPVWIFPANTTKWMVYPGQENVHGFNSVDPEWFSFDDHQGIYYHTQIGASQGHCPATVGVN